MNAAATVVLPTATPTERATAVARAVALLAAGEAVALPTETVYGLAARALDPMAVARIFAAKERPTFDPLIVHLPDAAALERIAAVPSAWRPLVARLTARFWPGALTLILPKRDIVPDLVTAGLPQVAVRVSAHPIFDAIVRTLDEPLAAPSANRFGAITPTSAMAVLRELGGRIPLIVDAGPSPVGVESTIVRLTGNARAPGLCIVRPGPVTPEDLAPYATVELRTASVIDSATDAPGQLARHYAPRTPLLLLDEAATFVPRPGTRYALLSLTGAADDPYVAGHAWAEVVVLAPQGGGLTEAAARLFACLRALDDGDFDVIVAAPIPAHGIGLAILDKLRRAAVPAAGGASR